MILCFHCGADVVFRNRGWSVPDCECGTLWATPDGVHFGISDGNQLSSMSNGRAFWTLDELEHPIPKDLPEAFASVLVYEVLSS